MLERIITASALILAILAARKLFWNTLSRRVQYALWGLVLLRLLIPWNLPAASFSLLTAARPVQQAVEQRLTVSVPVAPSAPVIRNQNTPASQEPLETQTVSPAVPESTQEHSTPREKNGTTVQPAATVPAQTTAPRTSLSLTSLLNVFWMTGAGLMALFLGISNLRFALRMRRCRTLLREAEPGHPAVYLVPDEAVSSPCLFGAKIYVPRSAAGDPERLRMILLHEETHARHLDPLWSLLRGLCLALWWFNPLVWIAAFCSRTDCELACDESVLARLSADEGYLYGKTLLSMSP